jgi:hypothetical protein
MPVVSSGREDQVMEVGEVVGIHGDDQPRRADGPGEDARVRGREQADIPGKDNIMARAPKAGGAAMIAEILVDQQPQETSGGISPRARRFSVSRS